MTEIEGIIWGIVIMLVGSVVGGPATAVVE